MYSELGFEPSTQVSGTRTWRNYAQRTQAPEQARTHTLSWTTWPVILIIWWHSTLKHKLSSSVPPSDGDVDNLATTTYMSPCQLIVHNVIAWKFFEYLPLSPVQFSAPWTNAIVVVGRGPARCLTRGHPSNYQGWRCYTCVCGTLAGDPCCQISKNLLQFMKHSVNILITMMHTKPISKPNEHEMS